MKAATFKTSRVLTITVLFVIGSVLNLVKAGTSVIDAKDDAKNFRKRIAVIIDEAPALYVPDSLKSRLISDLKYKVAVGGKRLGFDVDRKVDDSVWEMFREHNTIRGVDEYVEDSGSKETRMVKVTVIYDEVKESMLSITINIEPIELTSVPNGKRLGTKPLPEAR